MPEPLTLPLPPSPVRNRKQLKLKLKVKTENLLSILRLIGHLYKDHLYVKTNSKIRSPASKSRYIVSVTTNCALKNLKLFLYLE